MSHSTCGRPCFVLMAMRCTGLVYARAPLMPPMVPMGASSVMPLDGIMQAVGTACMSSRRGMGSQQLRPCGGCVERAPEVPMQCSRAARSQSCPMQCARAARSQSHPMQRTQTMQQACFLAQAQDIERLLRLTKTSVSQTCQVWADRYGEIMSPAAQMVNGLYSQCTTWDCLPTAGGKCGHGCP